MSEFGRGALDEALWEGIDRAARYERRHKVMLLSVIAVAGLVAVGTAWFVLGSDGSDGPAVAAPTPTTTALGWFDFSDAVRLGTDLRSLPGAVVVPECFGPVTRLALIGTDLRSTSWEVVATDPDSPPLVDRVDLGSVPEGFREVVPLDQVPNVGIIVVNGSDNLGLLSLDEVDSSAAPSGC